MSYRYFVAKKSDGKLHSAGTTSCQFGNPMTYHGRRQGYFGEWDWDGEKQQLTAQVDALGFFNLFYYADRDCVMISPSPIQLISLGAPADPDPRALAVFFMIGWQLEQDTPFKHIKVLPPNGTLTWRDGTWSVSGGKEICPETAMSSTTAIDGFIDRFRSAVKSHLDSLDRADGDILLPLSGGRDSRHILFEMRHFGRQPSRCLTHGNRLGCDPDVAAAIDVAKAVQAEHEIVNNRSSPIRDQIIVLLMTHFCSDESAQFVAMSKHLGRMPHKPVLFDGLAGDVLSRNKAFSNPAMHTLCRRGEWGAVVDDGLRKTNDKILSCSFADRASNLAKPYLDEARSYLVETLKTYENAADPWTAFLFWNRTRREIGQIPISILAGLGDRADVRCPYIDLDLVSHLMSVPFELTADGKFHDKVIAAEFPEFAWLRYHDDYQANYIRPSVTEKLRIIRDGVSAATRINPANFALEFIAQVSPLFSAKSKSTLKWRLYKNCLDAVDSPAKASRFMDIVGRIESEA